MNDECEYAECGAPLPKCPAATERDRLRGLLMRVLDTGEAEARAKLQLDNARKNYTSHRDYLDTWVAAAQAASDAEKAARAALGAASQQSGAQHE